FGMHEIELNPGIKEEDFENFFLKEMSTAPLYPGWSMRLLKGDRGARAGKYLMLIDIESAEARDRFAPGPNQGSEETDQFQEEHKEVLDALFQKWATFSHTNFGENLNYTDYLVLND
ncbi:MAG: hypothetical protein ACXW4M_05225, partial [Anaerolineales bacterium]